MRSRNETKAMNSVQAEVIALKDTLDAFNNTFPDLTDEQINTFRHLVYMSQQRIAANLGNFVYSRNRRQKKYS